jgi:hypothetical protein
MVRIYVGRDPETRKRNYIAKSINGGLRTAQAHLNHILAERDGYSEPLHRDAIFDRFRSLPYLGMPLPSPLAHRDV